jgi:hypothetical protein
VLFSALAVAVIALGVGALVKLTGEDPADDDRVGGDPSSSAAASPSAGERTGSATPTASTTSSPTPVESSGPQSSPVTGTVVIEERFEGQTAFPVATYDANTGSMVSKLLPGALRVSVKGISPGWDAWVSVDTPSPLSEWTVRASFVSAASDGACGVMASDGPTVVTADLYRGSAVARISIYDNGTPVAQKSFTAPSVTGPVSLSLEGGVLVMRAGDVVVASLPPRRLDPITQGGVVAVGDTNDCDFDDFQVLSRP